MRTGARVSAWRALGLWLAAVGVAVAGEVEPTAGGGGGDAPAERGWRIEDLAPLLAVGLEDGRDFAAGRRVFERARCVRCHGFGDDRERPGPRLTGVGRRLSPDELLQAILEPDHRIDPRHAATLVSLRNGTVVHGVIVREEAGRLWLQPDLADEDSVREVAPGEVVARRRSPISPMPSGLLDREPDYRVLDLLAYLLSGGDEEHPMFDRHGAGD